MARPAPDPGPPPAPLSTYRLQLRPGFGFDEAAALAPYLAELGVSHLYSSPCLQAAPGSTHGYDVVDPTRPNAELGGADGLARLSSALGEAGLGLVLDVVPNHMAITGPENAWWWDVLENGPSSVYASYFDVDWDPPEAKLRNSVLLPILADHYGKVLEAGHLTVERDGGSFRVRYADRVAPVAPRSLDTLLGAASAAVRAAGPAAPPAPAVGAGPPAPPAGVADELESIAAALGNLPPSWATDRESVRARHRDKEVLRARLAELCADEPAVAAAVDAELAAVNADPEALDALLERQNYRLAYWRAAGQEVDYRRFFDIDSLVGVRIEDEAVFQDSHALVLSWLHDGVVDGLRIDHIDGLRDPEGYLHRLRTAAGDAWIVVEKVLEPGERLRDTWPVAGTTGYDFCALVGGLFVDPAGEAPLTELWERLSGSAEPFAEVAHAAKHAAMAGPLATDLARLTALLVRVGEGRRRYRDYTRAELAATLEEVVACLGVYRTYVGEVGPAHPDDAARVLEAVAEAARRREDLDPDLLDGLARILLADETMAGDAETELRLRFQQVAGPVMAKGVEDTALYRYCRFVGRNEVGSDPGRWATPAGELHAACAATQGRWPTTMVTTSTHDTKRSEDVRARLAVLSEMAAAWAERASAWRERNAGYRTGSDPDAGAEYLLYQTMVGAWPIDADRMVAYMAKATKEAKLRTSWTDPDPAYDGALERFVRGVMGDDGFVEDLSSFVDCRLKESGWASSLAQTLVALTAPGVPDTYQGCELWDYSLVDPDNRRPVDFARRRRLLAELPSLSPEECWERAAEGLPKLLVTQRALHLRRERPQWWGAAGSYRPLAARGPQADRVVAFVRAGSAATVVPRLAWGLYREGLRAAHPQAQQPVAWARLQAGAPGCTIAGLPGYLSTALLGTTVELPSGRWRNVLTGDHLSGGAAGVGEMLHRFPVALLAREG